MSVTQAVDTGTVSKPKVFRFSVLVTAIGRFFRSFVALIIVILGNALIQAVLVRLNPDIDMGFTFVITAILSFIVLLWSFYCFNLVAIEGAVGKPTLNVIFKRTGKQWGRFLLWAVIVYLAVLIGLIVWAYLGIAILLVFPFVTLAAADDRPNPLKTNFQVIGGRPIRYIITAVIFFPIMFFFLFLTAANGFFIGGGLGSFVMWVVWGVIASWYMCALGLIYRSTTAGGITESDLPAPKESHSTT